MDEKWGYVYKKRGHCTPEELEQERVGDCWDHIAFDPEHRLVLGSGARYAGKSAAQIVGAIIAETQIPT